MYHHTHTECDTQEEVTVATALMTSQTGTKMQESSMDHSSFSKAMFTLTIVLLIVLYRGVNKRISNVSTNQHIKSEYNELYYIHYFSKWCIALRMYQHISEKHLHT